MKLKFEFQLPGVNKERFTRALEEQTLELRNEAVRVYTESVFTRIPVWSGASRATLIPLGELVEMANLEGRIDPVAFPPVDYPHDDPNHGIDSGIAHGGAELDDAMPRIGFRFFTNLYQFWLYESKDLWGAMAAGERAVERFLIKEGKNYLPRLVDYIRFRKR